MSYPLVDGAEVRLSAEERKKLGVIYKAWAEGVQDDRRKLMQETWVRALINYEGKASEKQFPWPGASNAVIPITSVHVDSLEARHFSAATAHDPVHLIEPGAEGEIIPGVTVEKFAQWWQNISKWIEKEELPFKILLEDICFNFVLYGDAWVYIPWETEKIMDVDLINGKVKKTVRTLWDHPVLKVLHPREIFVNSWETNKETAQRIGLRFDLDLQGLEIRAKQKIYDPEIVKELRQRLTGQQEKADSLLQRLNTPAYHKEYEGRFYPRDEFERKVREQIGLSDKAPNALRMLKMFVREDLDNDGIPEEIVFDVEMESGLVPYARYANLLHRLRPLVQFFYSKRPGSIYNRGVGELLFNIQKILTTTVRDIMDNNKVQNTKMFVARKGSPIEEEMKVYPSRLIFTDNPKEDFLPVDLGSGRPITSISDVSFMMTWGERLTGISDANLGMERRSRTPATSQLALLEEGSQRRDRSIDLMRESMREMWWQVIMLYLQNGDAVKMSEVAATEKDERELFLSAHAAVDVDLFRSKVIVRPEVSSNSLNRSVQRQEKLALMSLVQDYYQKVVMLANAIGGAGEDPAMRELFLTFAKGGRRIFQSVLDTFDMKNQDELNPDFDKLLQEVTSVEVSAGNPGEASRRSNPASAAAGLAANTGGFVGPEQAPGRPVPGLSRVPGTTSGV